MKFFSKEEFAVISIVLLVISVVSLYNFRLAIRRSRDSQRRSDLGHMSRALEDYKTDFAFLPPSEDQRMLACKKNDLSNDMLTVDDKKFNLERFFDSLRPCEWGEDGLRDLGDPEYPAYIQTLPIDPRADKGYKYVYLSTMSHFQVYAYLEGEESEDEFNPEVAARNIDCGGVICNYGRTIELTPLGISLEEYEAELMKKVESG